MKGSTDEVLADADGIMFTVNCSPKDKHAAGASLARLTHLRSALRSHEAKDLFIPWVVLLVGGDTCRWSHHCQRTQGDVV